MLENGEDCRLKEYLIAGPCQGMGACTEDWGKAGLGAAPPGASVVMVRWALAAFHLPETAALGYDPHGLGQHDMKWGSSAPQQCRLSDQHSSLSAELSVVWKSLLPFLKHFLAIRKLPECRQVVRDPWKKPRIWRTLKLRGGQWIAIMVFSQQVALIIPHWDNDWMSSSWDEQFCLSWLVKQNLLRRKTSSSRTFGLESTGKVSENKIVFRCM